MADQLPHIEVQEWLDETVPRPEWVRTVNKVEARAKAAGDQELVDAIRDWRLSKQLEA